MKYTLALMLLSFILVMLLANGDHDKENSAIFISFLFGFLGYALDRLNEIPIKNKKEVTQCNTTR